MIIVEGDEKIRDIAASSLTIKRKHGRYKKVIIENFWI